MRLFNFAAVVSLMLCLATVVLWVRTYDAPENWTLTATNRYIARSYCGKVSLSQQHRVVLSLDGIPDFAPAMLPTVLQKGHLEPFSSVWLWNHERPRPWNRMGITWGEQPDGLVKMSIQFRPGQGSVLEATVARLVAVPYWLLFCVTACTPLIQAGRWVARHWRRSLLAGLCSSCGYNLTGNTSGICPECGTPIDEAARAKA